MHLIGKDLGCDPGLLEILSQVSGLPGKEYIDCGMHSMTGQLSRCRVALVLRSARFYNKN